MLEFLKQNAVLIAMAIVALAALGYIAYLIYKRKWDDLRVLAHLLFIKAEKKFIGTKRGQERFRWVANQIYDKTPPWFKLFVSRETMEKYLELWFRVLWTEMKDILDNGKRDKSAKIELETVGRGAYKGPLT